jgi:hypothetical protein
MLTREDQNLFGEDRKVVREDQNLIREGQKLFREDQRWAISGAGARKQ